MGNVSLYGYHLTFDTEMTWATDSVYFLNHYNNGDRTISSSHELEQYVDNNPNAANNPYSYQNSALVITASPIPAGGLPYTSGILNTGNDFYQNQGYFEVRAQVTGTSGFWPAFWLYSDDGGEIDIMEQPNNDGPTNYYTSIKSYSLSQGSFNNAGTDVTSGYHTYGVMWTATAIEFTFDGNFIGYWTATPVQLQAEKMYLIANLAVGGWPPPPAPGATGQYKIDYIRAYSTDPSLGYWYSQDPVQAPDGADTSPYTLPVLPTLGSGSDTLVLNLSEDAYKGDAQFTVSVDGVQLGGVMTASGSNVFQQSQALTIRGNFTAGRHTVSVSFINDASDSGGDRNMFVKSAAIDGSAITGSTLSYYWNKTDGFAFQVNHAFQPTITVGSGPDMLSLQVAEDAYAGDAQFTVSVDGVQIGGVLTASVLKNSGSTQAFDVLGSFGTTAHTVTVNFLNDAWGGSASTDRNLYVTQASINDAVAPASSLALLNGGPQSFSFQAKTSALATSASSSDTLVIGVSEDAWQGDAQYTVSVDGVQTGTTYTATASHAAGKINLQTITGAWGPSTHKIGVSFINDAWGGAAGTDRNLFVNSVAYDGTAVPTSTVALLNNGTATFNTAPTLTTATPRLLTLYLSEDAFQGDAQFSLTIDGTAIGAAQTVTAQHAAGASQAFSFADVLTAGTHDVALTYLNDLTAPNAIVAGDRNLYLTGADLNGVMLSPATWNAAFPTSATQHFNLVVPT